MPTYDSDMPKLTVDELRSALQQSLVDPSLSIDIEIGGLEMHVFPGRASQSIWESTRHWDALNLTRRFVDFVLALERQVRGQSVTFSLRCATDGTQMEVGFLLDRRENDYAWMPCEVTRVGQPGPTTIFIPFVGETFGEIRKRKIVL